MSVLVPIAKGFTSIRGSFKLGAIDLGTQTSLVQKADGKFVLLDSLTMEPPIRAEVDKLTDNGKNIEAIINVHPFHTLHCAWAHAAFPRAKLYGSERHVAKFPDLPWERELVDSPEMAAKFPDLVFSVPKGVDFISCNENVHFSSVLVYHPATKTCHSDDTFLFVPLPKVAEVVGVKSGAVALHPTLPLALERRPGAAEDFREWLSDLASTWDIKNLCAAHSGDLLEKDNVGGKAIGTRLTDALWLSEPILLAHEAIYGKRARM